MPKFSCSSPLVVWSPHTRIFFNDSTRKEFYRIPGFYLLRKGSKSCKASRGGEILMYVNNELNIKRRTDLKESDLEVLCLQVCPLKSKRNILMAAIYPPPNVKCEVDKKLAENIERVHMLNRETILTGDFNIDWLNCSYKKHRLVKALKDFKFTQLVTKGTRPAINSCLDHIWCNARARIVNIVCPNICICLFWEYFYNLL